MKTTIVIPTYNERENIKKLIPRIFGAFERHNIRGSVIVVDDNSPDGTAQEIKKLQKIYSITLLERSKKTSLGSAYIEGFRKALTYDTDLIFEMDADLSHDPNDIPKFIEKIKEGYDVVVGSRLIDGGRIVGWSSWRRLISFGGNFIGKHIAGVDISDLTSGYRVYKSDVLKGINLEEIKSRGYDFQLEMLWRSIKGNFRVGVVPIIFSERKRGRSKLSRADIINFFLTSIKIRLNLI